MADYYTPGTPATANTLARAENIDTELTTIKAAFDKIPEQVSLEQDRAAYALDTGAADAYLVAMPNTWTAYTTGASLRMKAVNANTGASTINVDGLGVKSITRFNGDALSAGDIPADSVLEYYYDGTSFQLAGGPATVTNAVIGPSSATDNAVMRFNGTTGKVAQDTSLVVITDTPTMGIGIAAPDGTLHVHTGTAGAVTADANTNDLVVENADDVGISLLSPDASLSRVRFGSPSDASGAVVRWDFTNGLFDIGSSTANAEVRFLSGDFLEVIRLDANGMVLINDTANANMTIGLTINQGAADDEILALKNSDVDQPATDAAGDDTFGTFQKVSLPQGGLRIDGYTDGGSAVPLDLNGTAGNGTLSGDLVSSDIGSRGVVSVRAFKSDGGTSRGDLAAGDNVFGVLNNQSMRFLIQGDGGINATNVTAGSGDLDGTALDHEDDIGLIRVFERTVHNGMGIAMSKWDEAVKGNEDDLKRLGVLSPEGDFYNMQRMNSLLGGAIWQLYTRLMETNERLALALRKLALPAN